MSNHKRIFGIIVLILGLLAISNGTKAQNVVRKGNTFVQQTKTNDSTATSYYYQDNMGKKYPIFLSSKGKAYCWVTSKKTNKQYRKYLPKITEEINKKKM